MPMASSSGRVLSVSDHFEGGFERPLGADLLEHLTGGPLVALVDQSATAEFGRIHSDGGGDLVHVLFERPTHLRSGRGADRA